MENKSSYNNSKIWLGAMWKIISCGCFASINALVRYLSGGSPIKIAEPLPIYILMFFQHVIGAAIILAITSFKVKIKVKISNNNSSKLSINLANNKYYGLHAIRIIIAALGTGMWYLSLRYIPITQAVALSFTAPFVTWLSAIIFLKEKMTFSRVITTCATILGSFLIIRPDLSLQAQYNVPSNWLLLLPLIATLLFALDKVICRKLLTMNESPANLTLYLLLFMSPLCLLPTLWYGWTSSYSSSWLWLLLLGAFSASAHYAFSKAYSLAEVTFLMPFGMAKIILCALVSYFAFLEIPNTVHLWIGIIILTFSSILLKPNNKIKLCN